MDVDVKVKFIAVLALVVCVLSIAACSPEVGSDAWCDDMKTTPKGDWSTNDAGSYAKHCMFK